MAATLDIDTAIHRLDAALRGAGLAGLEPPADSAGIDEVADAVAPYALPAELRRYWERVDEEVVSWFLFPRVCGPAETLALLRLVRDDTEFTYPIVPPPPLLPVDYASHCYGVIELASEWSDGGTLFEWDFDEARVVSHTLADRIDLLAELVAEDHLDRVDEYVSIDHVVEAERRPARLAASSPHPLYGQLHTLPTALESWPAHWLAASGVDLGTRVPLGATHTIAELVAAAGAGPAGGRVHAEVTRLVGSAAGALVVIDDGTRPLDVWCPAEASLWGPVHRTRFEFELTIEGPVGPPPDLDSGHEEVSRHALAGELGAAQAAVLSFLEQLDAHRPAAVATDIRPLD
jgi:hypothetical protein